MYKLLKKIRGNMHTYLSWESGENKDAKFMTIKGRAEYY